MRKEMNRRPERLKQGDRIAIITPAAPVRQEFVEGAAKRLEEDYGLVPIIMPHALDEPEGIFASSLNNRLEDFIRAWEDDDIKAILCSRGGYGAVQLIPQLQKHFQESGTTKIKWLIGFSDITIFHSFLSQQGIQSIHGPMAKNIATTPNTSVETLFRILLNDAKPRYEIPAHPFNTPGKAEGILCGGNFATFNGLISTPIDPFAPINEEGLILFIEDVGEQIYKINRLLYHLELSGVLKKLKGIVVGQFTEYKPDRSFSTMKEMISETLNRFEIKCPVIYDFPSGHVDDNMPLIMGSCVEIESRDGHASLRHL